MVMGDDSGGLSAALVSAVTDVARSQGEIAGKLKAIDASLGRAVTELDQLTTWATAMGERTKDLSSAQIQQIGDRLKEIRRLLDEVSKTRLTLDSEHLGQLQAATDASLGRFCPITQSTFAEQVQTCVDRAFDQKLSILRVLTSKWTGMVIGGVILGLLAAVLILIGARDVKIGPHGLQFKADTQDLGQLQQEIKDLREALELPAPVEEG